MLPPPSQARSSTPVWVAALLVALAFVAFDSALQYQALAGVYRASQIITPLPAVDPASPTGYRDGLRTRVLQPGDSLHWVMQTQQMAIEDTLRVRHVAYDNAPAGREVHWALPFRGWLALVAWVDGLFTDLPPAAAIEHAALYASPLLLGVLLVGVTVFAARCYGAGPAALLALGLGTIGRLRAEFGVGLVDHHGISDIVLLLSLLLLVASGGGWLRAEGAPAVPWLPEARTARRRAVASGLCGALALWISASTAIAVLLCLGLGAAIALWRTRGHTTTATDLPRSDVWRWWSVSGAAASLLFFALEYAPSLATLRLEVNHPLYALAWLGGGELLHRLAYPGQPSLAPRGRSRAVLVACLLSVGAPALVVAFLGARAFAPADAFLSRLHSLSIEEFASTLATLRDKPAGFVVDYFLTQITLLPLLALPILGVLVRRQIDVAARTLLLAALVPALGGLLLGLYQVRWWHLSAALWLGVLTLGAALLLAAASVRQWSIVRKSLVGLLLVAVFLPYPVEVLRHGGPLLSPPKTISAVAAQKVALRDLAYWLREYTGGPALVASSPTDTNDLVYFGGHRGLGTLYWENHDGLRTIVGIHGARTAEETLQKLQAAGARYWVLTSWSPFVGPPAQLTQAQSATGTPETFLFRLLSSQEPFPAWARPLPFALPLREQQAGAWMLVFEIVAPPPKPEADTRLAQYLAATGQADAAIATLAPYAATADSPLLPLLALADLCRERGRAADFAALAQVVLARQSEHAALAMTDRITLARLLAALGRRDEALALARRCAADLSASPAPALTREQRRSLASLLAPATGSAPR